MMRSRSGLLLSFAVLLSFVGAAPAQELSKEYVYVGGRLLTVDIPAATGDPDLWIESLTAASSGPLGGSVEVGYTIRNSGGATSAATTVGFYFSTDSTITTADTPSSTTLPVSSAFAGASSGFVSVQIPSGLTAGSYYLGAIIDPPPGSVSESNEGNNTILAATGGAPGAFTVTSGSGTAPVIYSLSPTSGSGGREQFVAVFQDADGLGTLRDMRLLIGSSASTGCYVKYDHLTSKFYLRNDGDTGWEEVLEGSSEATTRCILDSTSTAMTSGADLIVKWEIAFKSPFSSGTAKNRTLEATDAAGLYSTSTIGTWTVPVPTLTIPSGSVASSGVVDGDVPISVNISNDGPELASVEVEFYRTTTSINDPPTPSPSIRVGSCTAETVPAEGSTACLGSIVLTSTGSHRIWAIFEDHSGAIEDDPTDEIGDVSISAGGSGADLGLTATSMYPRTLPVGGYGFMNFLVLNHEFVSYPVNQSSTVGLYLSEDPLVTTADHLLATCSVGSFSTWFSEACSYLFFEPNETGLDDDEDYYVRAIADIYDNVSESNESNQAATSGHVLHYGGDFEGTAIRPIITSLPSEASLGETISYSLKAQNVIPSNVAALGPFYGDIYISETGYLDVGWKQLLGSCTNWSENTKVEFWYGPSAPWETTCSGTVDIPSSVQGSDHFIVVDFRFANQTADSLLPGGHTTRLAIDLVLPPAVESVTPSSGSGREQIFTLTFSDRNGADDINFVHWLLNGALVFQGSCGILYYPGSNTLYLTNDAAEGWGTPITPGSGILSNSTCTIDGSGVVATSQGDELEITLPVTLDYPLGADQSQWMLAADSNGQGTGWVQAGTWTTPGVQSQPPVAVSASPSSGGGMEQAFTLTFGDPDGTVDLGHAHIIFNSSFTAGNSCYLIYKVGTDSILLLNDGATAWSSPAVLGTSVSLENSQCKIDVSDSSSTTTGVNIELTLDVEFLPSYEGARNIYLSAFDMSGYSSGSQTLGTWNVQLGAGTLLREYWTGISGSDVTDLTGDADYPYAPAGSGQLTSFEAPTDFAENFGDRIRGYLHAPSSGNYEFWIASDNSSELWLSTDADPTNKILIASVSGWTSVYQWTKFSSQYSSSVSLTAGEVYYIEALHKDGGGPDNLAVAWQGPGISQEVIPGAYLSPFIPAVNTGSAAAGQVEPHWTINGSTAYVTTDSVFPFPYWMANGDGSKWISPQVAYGSGQGDAPGTYTYSTSFDLGSENPSTASITFVVVIDNDLTDVKINGTSTGLTATGYGAFSSPMTIDSGFVYGTNTLEFVTTNGGTSSSDNPAGLRVEFQY